MQAAISALRTLQSFNAVLISLAELLPAGLAFVAPAGLFFWAMLEEPPVKRAVAFYDGQNLYHHAKDAFAHYHPNYDPIKLFSAICAQKGWQQVGIRFYTGVPLAGKNPFWHGFWSKKLLALRRAGVLVTDRKLKYQTITAYDENGDEAEFEVPHEKGIDVRLALDVIRLALTNQFDVACIFSQDQDLAEIVEDVREIARVHDRWIKIASAFPSSATASARRGIDGTEWVQIDRATYDACLDPRDYRP